MSCFILITFQTQKSHQVIISSVNISPTLLLETRQLVDLHLKFSQQRSHDIGALNYKVTKPKNTHCVNAQQIVKRIHNTSKGCKLQKKRLIKQQSKTLVLPFALVQFLSILLQIATLIARQYEHKYSSLKKLKVSQKIHSFLFFCSCTWNSSEKANQQNNYSPIPT